VEWTKEEDGAQRDQQPSTSQAWSSRRSPATTPTPESNVLIVRNEVTDMGNLFDRNGRAKRKGDFKRKWRRMRYFKKAQATGRHGPIGVSLPIMLLGILSLVTLKPVFMQAYGIVYIIQVVFFTFSIITYYLLYVTDNDHLSTELPRTSTELPRTAVTDFPRAAEPHTGKNLRHTFLISFAFLVFIYLRGWITLNFYKYVRDRQLAMEQLGSHHTHVSDVEYQEGKLVR